MTILNSPQNKQDEIKIEIGTLLKERPLEEWTGYFVTYEACVSPVLTFEEMINDPQIKNREMIRNVPGIKGKHIGNSY